MLGDGSASFSQSRWTPSLVRHGAVLGCCLAAFLGVVGLLHATVRVEAHEAEAILEFRQQVHLATYLWPFLAFVTATLINVATLLTEDEPVKLRIAMLAVYINAVAGMSDALSLMQMSTLVRSTWGVLVNLERFAMWGFTTPAMVLMMGFMSDLPRQKVQQTMGVLVVLISAGIGGHLLPWKPLSVASFGVAFSCFGFVNLQMWRMFNAGMRTARSTGSRANIAFLRVFNACLWASFPSTFLLVQLGLVRTPQLEEWLWCSYDFFGKYLLRDRIQVVLEIRDIEERKERLLSSMTHELRTPLNGVVGLSDALLMSGQVGAGARKTISTIKHSGLRLLRLVNDILDAASIKRGKLTIKEEYVDLRRIVDDVLELASTLVRKDVVLRNEMPLSTPPVLGDSGRITQVLHNLVGNSTKFTHSGSISIRAVVRKGAGFVEVEVADTGIGIPEAKHGAIFEAFEQVDTATTRKYGGTGLGLNLVKQLVEAHGGTIWVKSAVGKGTSFHFTLKMYESVKGHKGPTSPGVGSSMPSRSISRATSASNLAERYAAAKAAGPSASCTTLLPQSPASKIAAAAQAAAAAAGAAPTKSSESPPFVTAGLHAPVQRSSSRSRFAASPAPPAPQEAGPQLPATAATTPAPAAVGQSLPTEVAVARASTGSQDEEEAAMSGLMDTSNTEDLQMQLAGHAYEAKRLSDEMDKMQARHASEMAEMQMRLSEATHSGDVLQRQIDEMAYELERLQTLLDGMESKKDL